MGSDPTVLRRPARPETALLVAAGLAVAITSAVALPVAGLAAGASGLAGAGVAIALLVVLFGVSAGMHAAVAPLGWSAFMLTTLGGLVLRIVLYFVAVRALADVDQLHRPSLAVTAVAGIVLGQILEMRALAKRPARVAPRPGAAEMEGADR